MNKGVLQITRITVFFPPFQAQLIAQSIGQAFQVAYMEFLKANGIEDPGLMKEIDYQEVLNQQQIYGEELTMFSNKENQKEVRRGLQKCEVFVSEYLKFLYSENVKASA